MTLRKKKAAWKEGPQWVWRNTDLAIFCRDTFWCRLKKGAESRTRFWKALNLIFPKLSSQNMRGFDHATIFSPSFHGLLMERLAQWLPFCVLNTTKNALQIMSLTAYASETNLPALTEEKILCRLPCPSNLSIITFVCFRYVIEGRGGGGGRKGQGCLHLIVLVDFIASLRFP